MAGNQNPEILVPLQYDEKRLKKFLFRACYNLPHAYKPPKDADGAAVADAIIGQYLESRHKPELYDVAMGRAEYTVKFLSRGNSGELMDEYARIGTREGKATHWQEYALDVAGLGARHFRDRLGQEAAPGEAIEQNETCNSYDTFVELGDFIRILYEEGRISNGHAQSLLLLFRQANSSAPIEMRINVIADAARTLKAELRSMIAKQPHRGDHLEDATLRNGAKHINTILENPLMMLRDDGVLIKLAKDERAHDRSLDLEKAYKSVLGYIGYTLNILYPSKDSTGE